MVCVNLARHRARLALALINSQIAGPASLRISTISGMELAPTQEIALLLAKLA